MTTSNVMENSNTPAQTQDPPVTEPMVEAAARAMWEHDTGGTCWKYAATNFAPAYRASARVALIAGIAAALEKRR